MLEKVTNFSIYLKISIISTFIITEITAGANMEKVTPLSNKLTLVFLIFLQLYTV